MNYRHAFHAGNFADVAKHTVLALLIERLKAKDAAFRVIDTHAGAGRYDLDRGPATRTGEWQRGIGRLLETPLPAELETLLSPYLGAVREMNADGSLRVYPGSPVLIRALLRRQDRLTAIELHPDDAQELAAQFAGDRQVRVVHLDGWLALAAFVPPKERRGLVLVDPPYEVEGEFDRLFDTFARAHRRWPGGIYALWYPIKDRVGVRSFLDRLKASGIPEPIAAELLVGNSGAERLDGAGLVIANTPWHSQDDIEAVLTGLARVLAEDGTASCRIEALTDESP